MCLNIVSYVQMKLPKFLLYGQDNPSIEAQIQPALSLRNWGNLSKDEKEIAFIQLGNSGWLEEYSDEILRTITYLNHKFLRQLPGRHLHAIKPEHYTHGSYGNESERKKAARMDFQHVFLSEKSDAMVFRMISKFAELHIDSYAYNRAEKCTEPTEQKKMIEEAYEKFDRLANCLNHIFEQFAVNQILTRNGLVPRQDDKITKEVYTPVLQILADPKWKSLSSDLSEMFEDYRNENFPEAITKAHRTVQRFLQILVGEEGKNAKGEVGQLFQKAKSEGVIPINRFTEPFINTIQGFIVSERATNSTAKPTLKEATASDALLMMNMVMIFLQYCLQNTNRN
ncbi:MAG: hypothetical protein UV94_C0001G0018 [Parcubacteria group bacterium GW2011_GWC1_43_30]|nr:MAG: hypothetical protein UV94_C0001G0018 [Parcubacteria group bacterium GW2011_GWC1_43_30]